MSTMLALMLALALLFEGGLEHKEHAVGPVFPAHVYEACMPGRRAEVVHEEGGAE